MPHQYDIFICPIPLEAEHQYGFARSPVIEGNLVILTANASSFALNKNKGEKVWASPINKAGFECGYVTPVIFTHKDIRCVLFFSTEGLFSVNVETGKQLWIYEWHTEENAADLIIFNNKIFISSGCGVGCALLKLKGSKAIDVSK